MNKTVFTLSMVLLGLTLVLSYLLIFIDCKNNSVSTERIVVANVTTKATEETKEVSTVKEEILVAIETTTSVTEVSIESSASVTEASAIDYTTFATTEEVAILAQAIYGEAGVVESTTEKMAIGWAILNQVDSTDEDFVQWDTLDEVVCSQKWNIQGYWAVDGQSIPESYIKMSKDILARWYAEKDGVSVYRELPSGYTYWMGSFDGRHNYITCDYHNCNREWARDNAYQF